MLREGFVVFSTSEIRNIRRDECELISQELRSRHQPLNCNHNSRVSSEECSFEIASIEQRQQ